MKKLLVSLLSLVIFLPNISVAAVISSQELELLRGDMAGMGNCGLYQQAVNYVDYSAATASVPEWKPVVFKEGNVAMQIPWSPYWYVVGKQIPWENELSSNTKTVGQYVISSDPSLTCGLAREYTVSVYSSVDANTIKGFFHNPAGTTRQRTLYGQMTINGKPVALGSVWLSYHNTGHAVAVEITKNKKKYLVVITGSKLTPQMIQMVASVK